MRVFSGAINMGPKKESIVKKLRREMRKNPNPKFPQRRAMEPYISPEERRVQLLKLFDELYEKSDGSSSAPVSVLNTIRDQHRRLLPPDHWIGVAGHVPGVEVGRRFRFRAQLILGGLHRRTQAGIDWKEIDLRGRDKAIVALSVVSSGGYEDNLDEGETLIYTGEGGHERGSRKQVADQKLQRGNEALRNNYLQGTSVRVIRAYGKKGDRKGHGETLYYSYDGLYKVTGCEFVRGKSTFKVYKFRLEREAGQAPLVWSPPRVARREARRGFASSGRKRVRRESDEGESSASSSEGIAESSDGEENSYRDETSESEVVEGPDVENGEKERDGFEVEDRGGDEAENHGDETENDSNDSDESDEYEVESILDKRTVGRGTKKRIQYRVHWKGYPSDEDTWEPESNLTNCPEKLAQFKRDSE